MNKGITWEGGIVHKEAKDYRINCAVPWGEYTAGDVVLIDLEKKVEVRVDDAFIFRGECIAPKK